MNNDQKCDGYGKQMAKEKKSKDLGILYILNEMNIIHIIIIFLLVLFYFYSCAHTKHRPTHTPCIYVYMITFMYAIYSDGSKTNYRLLLIYFLKRTTNTNIGLTDSVCLLIKKPLIANSEILLIMILRKW